MGTRFTKNFRQGWARDIKARDRDHLPERDETEISNSRDVTET